MSFGLGERLGLCQFAGLQHCVRAERYRLNVKRVFAPGLVEGLSLTDFRGGAEEPHSVLSAKGLSSQGSIRRLGQP